MNKSARELASGDASRAGRLACFCPPGVATEGARPAGLSGGLFQLAGGFALAVLSQTLATSLLPLAGLWLAPRPALMAAPYMAMLIGAAVATFPASFLLDAFGRRASFALGASHGLAGGLMMAWALSAGAFWPFCLGAFWLGVAQGFTLFYRHEAAIGRGVKEKSLAIAIVFGAGALAGLVGPALLLALDHLLPAGRNIGVALAAALAQVLVLTVAVSSASGASPSGAREAHDITMPDFVVPTVIAAAAWFGMTAQMLAMPGAMVGCGVTISAMFGVMAFHVMAMYAPAFLVGPLVRGFGVASVAVVGLALMVAAKVLTPGAASVGDFTLVLGLLAVGWSLATTAATLWLHHRGSPARLWLAGHDALLFAAALAGAALSARPMVGLI